jgi:hypothetical protein
VDGWTCDGCGEALLADSDVRYIVKIEVYAAYDPLEVSREEAAADHREEMARLIETMRGMDPGELEDQVHKSFRFDLCPRCQKVYLRDPLPFRRPAGRQSEPDGT